MSHRTGKELAAVDPDSLDDAELSGLVVEVTTLRTRLEATEVALTAAWDRRRVWAGDGAKSGAAWLARSTAEPKAACGARVWLGRKLRHLACGYHNRLRNRPPPRW